MTDLAERRGLETAVYQPAEDSRLLLEAVEGDIEASDRILDVGTGSGFVGAELATRTGASVLGVDVNPLACRQASERGLPVVRANLVDAFADRAFDVVAFNPPYLPAVEEARREDWMEVAITGGETGRTVIEPFLETVGRVLAEGGTVYLLASSLSDLDAVNGAARQAGFAVEEVASESFPFEKLVVYRLR